MEAGGRIEVVVVGETRFRREDASKGDFCFQSLQAVTKE